MPQPLLRLESARLILRSAVIADVAAILRYFIRNKKHLEPFEPTRADNFFTETHWEENVRKNEAEYAAGRSCRLFLFHRIEPKEVIGVVNFNEIVRGVFQACYLGYSLDENQQGNGYMTEALQTAIAFVFAAPGQGLNLHRIMANHMPRNAKSAAVLKRLGFTQEGVARDYLLINGRWEDHVLTSLTNKHWANR